MTLQVSVLPGLPVLMAGFDKQHAQTQALDFPLVPKSEQEQQAIERQHLVNHINDLCDCV
jgi:hypothetical protein